MAPAALVVDQSPVSHHLGPDCPPKPAKGEDFYSLLHPSSRDPSRLIGKHLKQQVETLDHELDGPDADTTFYVADLGEIYRQHRRWEKHLPRVQPFYAVKCNPDRQVLGILAALGTGFDCASKSEIEQVMSLAVSPERMIYANPCKAPSHIDFARTVGVKRTTFDNLDELHKMARLFPDAELVLRIATDDTGSRCQLSKKFGASPSHAVDLLSLAQSLDLNVMGVSFHVGSGASDLSAFYKAIRSAHTVFELGRQLGFQMSVLDIGGGFCNEMFEPMAEAASDALDAYFPPSYGARIIAEPGRYYVASAFTLACSIIGRHINPRDDVAGSKIYMSDGVYGSFLAVVIDKERPVARILRAGGRFLYNTADSKPCATGHGEEYSLWGPTCDSADLVCGSTRFQWSLDVGDWLYFDMMGAYTLCSATKFNGFDCRYGVIYMCSEPALEGLWERKDQAGKLGRLS